MALHQLGSFFSTDKLKITDNPVGIEIPGGERSAATESLALCLSLAAGVVVVRTISDQIKSKALLTNCFWLASVPFFVLSMPCPVSLLQLNRKLITVL